MEKTYVEPKIEMLSCSKEEIAMDVFGSMEISFNVFDEVFGGGENE